MFEVIVRQPAKETVSLQIDWLSQFIDRYIGMAPF